MKKISLIIFCLCISSSIISFFKSSPWVIIENQTPFYLDCHMQISCQNISIEKKDSFLKIKNNENICIDYQKIIDENEKKFIFVELHINSQPKTTINLEELFTIEDEWSKPIIQSVSFVNKSLQLKFFGEVAKENRYFCATYQPYIGITITSEPISIYVKCLYNLQDIAYSAAAVISSFTKWRS